MSKREWYSVKCVFEHDGLARRAGATIYEERVVILRAVSLEDALAQGEAEAREYAGEGDGAVHYAGFVSAYRMGAGEIGDRTEVYALMRESFLPRETFLTHYFDDGSERTQRHEDGAERDR